MEAKTIEQIKDEVAKNSGQGFENWEHFILCINTYPEYSHLLDEFIKEVAEQYAYQKCEEQIKVCFKQQHTKEGFTLDIVNVCNPKIN